MGEEQDGNQCVSVWFGVKKEIGQFPGPFQGLYGSSALGTVGIMQTME
jgi:hypothetical protein